MTPPRSDSAIVILRLRPDPTGPDTLGRSPELRLRGLLRRAVRDFGWRIVTLELPPPGPAEPGGGER